MVRIIGTLLWIFSLPSLAAPAPCSQEPYNAFDFWLGQWEVRSPDGKLQGQNSITKEEGNCLIVERWRGAGGGTGQSYNYYDRKAKQWRQLWVSGGVIIDYTGNINAAGAMHLVGHIRYQADGREAEFTGTWSQQPDGTVLQQFKEKDPQTGEWRDWFTGVYARQQAAAG